MQKVSEVVTPGSKDSQALVVYPEMPLTRWGFVSRLKRDALEASSAPAG